MKTWMKLNWAFWKAGWICTILEQWYFQCPILIQYNSIYNLKSWYRGNKRIKLINIAQIDSFYFLSKELYETIYLLFSCTIFSPVIQKKCMNVALIIYIELHK